MSIFNSVTSRVSVPTSDPFDQSYVVSPGGATDAVVGVYNATNRGSGTLLGDGQWVLTAAHVIFNEPAANMQIAIDLPTGRVYLDVAETFVHEGYDGSSGFNPANDIALIRLAERAPIAGYDIYRGNAEIGSAFTLVGYGIAGTGLNGQLSLSEDPGSGDVKRTGQNVYEGLDGAAPELDDIFGEPIPDGSLLFYDFDSGDPANDASPLLNGLSDLGLGETEVNSTSGDSGGPNFINGQIAGVVSGGTTTSDAGTTDIDGGILNSSFGEISFDTRVSFYQNWIDNIVGDIFNDGMNPGDPILGGPGDPTDPTDPTDPDPGEPDIPDVTFPLPLPGIVIDMPTSGPITTPPSDLPFDETVFRFFNPTTGAHFYTASEAERDNIMATQPEFIFEAPVFEAGEPFFPGSVEVYRYFNSQNGGHLYTWRPEEMASIEANLPQYQKEGAVFRVSQFEAGGMEPVYRFFNTVSGTHLYTINEAERDLIEATDPNLSLDGIAWYAIPI